MLGRIHASARPWPCIFLLTVIHSGLHDMDGAEVDGYLLEVHPVKGTHVYVL